MPSYDLDRLGDQEFERLVQSLIKAVVGAGSITFGPGPDGGREATFEGRASRYPSSSEPWDGKWIFQAKYHDVGRLSPGRARTKVLSDLDRELQKIVNKYARECDNYILATNVPLTATAASGTIDRIASEIIPKYPQIRHIHVWGADDIHRMLEVYGDVRTAFLHLITPGDVLEQLLQGPPTRGSIAQTLRMYLATLFRREADAQLDQAGEVGEQPVQLQKIFIDVDCHAEDDLAGRTSLSNEARAFLKGRLKGRERPRYSALELLLSDDFDRVVLIGGPGEGKSTVGQYLAQIHRGALLRRLEELKPNGFSPVLPRLPLRVSLRDYAQWLTSKNGESDSLETFVSEDIKSTTGRAMTEENLHATLATNPVLLILDGLDEVMDQRVRDRMLGRIGEFLDRCTRVLGSNLQVLATSRPTAYSGQFDPAYFFHLTLATLTPGQVRTYVKKWTSARSLDRSKALRLQESIEECLEDPQISLLTNTPLQVTILILIILAGGTPPRQREALFNDYLDVIYKREKAKSPLLIRTERQLLFGLHQYIAYILHRNSVGSESSGPYLTQEEYEKAVLDFLRFNDPFSDDAKLDGQVADICREAGERFVLIVEARPGFWGFELRSIQEFFAASHLADTSKGSAQRYKRFHAIAPHPHWRNVSLFFAGRVGRRYAGEAANLLEVCKEIDDSGPDRFTRRGCWLALEIAADRAFGPNRRLQRSMIEYGLELLKAVPPLEEIELIGEQLAKLPKEDVNDHAVPTLQRNAELLAGSRLSPSLELLRRFGGRGAAERSEGLSRLGSSSAVEDRLEAIRLAVTLGFGNDQVGGWISELLDDPSDRTKRVLNDVFLAHPARFLSYLGRAKASPGVLSTVLDGAFENWWRFSDQFVNRPSTGKEGYELVGVYRLAYMTTEALRILANAVYEHGYQFSPQPTADRNPFGNVIREMGSVFGANEAAEIIRDPATAVIPPNWKKERHLATCIWLLHILVGKPSAEAARALHTLFEPLDSSHPAVVFGRQFARQLVPPLSLLLEQLSPSAERLAAAEYLLPRFAGGGVPELRAAFDEFLLSIGVDDDHQTALFQRVGTHFLPSAQRDAANARFREMFRVGIEWAPILQPQELLDPSDIRLTPQEASRVASSFLSAISSTDGFRSNHQFLRDFAHLPLPQTPGLKDLLLDLCGSLIALEVDADVREEVLGVLAVALFRTFACSLDEVLSILEALGSDSRKTTRLPVAYLYGSPGMNEAIRKVGPFVDVTSGTAQRGAALLVTSMLAVFRQFGPTRRESGKGLAQEDIFEWRRLVQSQDRILQQAALELAIVQSEPVDGDFLLVLDGFDKSAPPEEKEIWRSALMAVVSKGLRRRPEAWVGLLESRLEASGSEFLTKALAAALGRLLGARIPDINNREQDLGLPLS